MLLITQVAYHSIHLGIDVQRVEFVPSLSVLVAEQQLLHSRFVVFGVAVNEEDDVLLSSLLLLVLLPW